MKNKDVGNQHKIGLNLKENQLCKVIQVLKEDTRDSGSPYYREPLDLVLALLDDNSDLVLYHYDKRRFEPVDE